MDAMRRARLRFMLGGGFALATFTGRWRDTKDIDFYIHPADRKKAVAAMTKAGFGDYYARLPYDRNWIYRSLRSDCIVDLIWSMANQRAQVDDQWFARAAPFTIRGQQVQVIPVEEFFWCKLYIMQRDHCDWTDLFNLLYAQGPSIDWDHLLDRLEDDSPLLQGLLTVYAWLCQKHIRKLPASLWHRLNFEPPYVPPCPPGRNRISLLDSRRWFAANDPELAKLEV